MFIAFVFLLFLTGGKQISGVHPTTESSSNDGVLSQDVCTYQDILNSLNLTKSNELYTMARPVRNYKTPTMVLMDVTLYAILDLNEKEQRFVPYVWIEMVWFNEYISWEPSQFCELQNLSVPIEVLWKPDIVIAEMTEKDKAAPSSYLTISYLGVVYVKNDQVVISTCNMEIYNFPFDTQSCNLTFSSLLHPASELELRPLGNSTLATEWTREVIRSQNDWVFLNLTVTSVNASGPYGYDKIIYTITMKRRPMLYILNFLLPILFFLCLDLASFLISDGGEKLGFKVTVMLAVTVLQLILNDILPASSHRIPLIATYCIMIFGLMLLSVLETILVMHLMEKDSPSKENEADQSLVDDCEDKQGRANAHNGDREENKWSRWACNCNVSDSDTPSELLSVAEKGSGSKQPGESYSLLRISEELREMEKSLALLLSSQEEGGKPGYWTRVARRINRAFFIFYVISINLFLTVIFIKWNSA